MEVVKTNYGVLSWEDYCEIMAWQYGFDSYDDLLESGLYIDKLEKGDVDFEV